VLAGKIAFTRRLAQLRRVKCRVDGGVAVPIPQSGRIEARTGLRRLKLFATGAMRSPTWPRH
jgi:hypothetical protein